MKNKILVLIVAGLISFAGTEMVFAESNYALKFDGIDDYMIIPNNENLPVGIDDFSIEARFKITGEPLVNRFFYFCNKMIGNWESYLDIDWSEHSPEGYTEIYGDIWTDPNWTMIRTIKETAEPVRDIWHTFKIERIGTKMKIYLDNVLHNEIDYGIIADIPSADIYVGVDNLFIYWSEGLLDYMKIYKNSVLIGSWNFNEGAGITAYDNSGFSNNGIIYGSAVYEMIPEPEPVGVITAGFDENMPDYTMVSTTAYIGDLINSIGGFLWLIIGLPLGFLIIERTIKFTHLKKEKVRK